MTVEVNVKQMKQWSTRQSLLFHPDILAALWVTLNSSSFVSHTGYCFKIILFGDLVILSIHYGSFHAVLLGICWPITAECTLIQAQRPDVHLLLDFFQPTVNLRFSWPAIKIKYAVQLLPNYSAANPLFKK